MDLVGRARPQPQHHLERDVALELLELVRAAKVLRVEAGPQEALDLFFRGRQGPRLPEPGVADTGGQGRELWCEGGEAGFIRRMVKESTTIPTRCLWFTTLVSKSANLPSVRSALKQARVADFRVIEMAQGQKKSRIVAWTFFNPEQIQAWRTERWQTSAMK